MHKYIIKYNYIMIKKFEEFINENYYDNYKHKIYDYGVSLKHPQKGVSYNPPAKTTVKTIDGEKFYGLINVTKSQSPDLIRIEMKCLTDNPSNIHGDIDKNDYMSIIKKYKDIITDENSFYGKVLTEVKYEKPLITKIIRIYPSKDSCEKHMIRSLK